MKKNVLLLMLCFVFSLFDNSIAAKNKNVMQPVQVKQIHRNDYPQQFPNDFVKELILTHGWYQGNATPTAYYDYIPFDYKLQGSIDNQQTFFDVFCLDIDLASPGENGSVVEYQEKIDLAKYPKFQQAIKNIIESKTNYENNQFNKDYYVKLMALKILTIIDQDIKKPEQLSNQLNHHKVKLFKDAFDYNRPQRENNDFVNEKPEVAMIDQNTESYRLMANAYNIYLAAINKLEEIETDNYLQVETDNDKFNYNQSNDV